MQRVLIILALLLTLANVVSPAMAASFAVDHATRTVALADDDSCAVPAVDLHQKVSFKPCSKTVNGKSVSCHSPAMTLPVATPLQFPPMRHAWSWRDRTLPLAEAFAGQFRPPRSAVA